MLKIVDGTIVEEEHPAEEGYVRDLEAWEQRKERLEEAQASLDVDDDFHEWHDLEDAIRDHENERPEPPEEQKEYCAWCGQEVSLLDDRCPKCRRLLIDRPPWITDEDWAAMVADAEERIA